MPSRGWRKPRSKKGILFVAVLLAFAFVSMGYYGGLFSTAISSGWQGCDLNTRVCLDITHKADYPTTGRVRWQVEGLPGGASYKPYGQIYNWQTGQWGGDAPNGANVNANNEVRVRAIVGDNVDKALISSTQARLVSLEIEGDQDQDGIPDFDDKCPTVAGQAVDSAGNCILKCQVNPGELLVVEPFAAGDTVTSSSFRYPVERFCPEVHGVVVLDVSTEKSYEDTSLYGQLPVSVPSGFVYSFYYVAKNPGIDVVCEEGTGYDPETGKCILTPGIEFICSRGVFNEDLLKCTVNPLIETVCAEGTFSIEKQKCIKVIQADVETEFDCSGTFDPSTGICTMQPSGTAYDCLEGTYDAESNTCIVTPKFRTGMDPMLLMLLIVIAVIGVVGAAVFLAKKK